MHEVKHMNRKDREITDRQQITDLLERCNTIRIGFRGEEYPYVVPVSFGFKADEKNCTIYFHGAKKGLKAEQIKKYNKVCFESDIFYRTDELPHGITARYESIIGFGKVQPIEGNELIEGLKEICAHYGRADFDIERCRNLAATGVYKIEVDFITGKRNLPADKL